MSCQNQCGLNQILSQKFASLVKALNENSSVDTSIKASFRAMREVLEMQASNIEQLFKIVGKSATKSELHMLLNQKVSVVDMSLSIGQLADIVNRKVNTADVEQIVSQEVSKIRKNVEQAIKQVTSEQAVSSCILKQLADNQDNCRHRLDHMHSKIQGISKMTASNIQALKSDIDRSRTEWHQKHAEQSEEQIRIRDATEKLQKEFKKQIEEINKSIDKELKKATKTTKKSFDSMEELIKNSIDRLKEQLQSEVSTKIDTLTKETIRTYETEKIQKTQNSKNVQPSLKDEIFHDIRLLRSELDSKTSLNEVKLAFKAFQQDTLYNIQAAKDAINRRVDHHHTSFLKYEKDQNIIYETLCAVNVIGRWSCKYQQEYACWDVELANTLKENYNWSKGQDSLNIRMSGMYHIVAGCFIDTQIAVLVNDRVVSREDVKNKSEDISRTTQIYVFLYENTKLSVSFGPYVEIQGFLWLQRM